jgi:phosphogluconate dehydratase
MAKSAGIIISWDDFSDLSEVIPLVARVYPNGPADVNHFHAAGGMAFVIQTLLEKGLLNEDVNTILGLGLNKYTKEPKLIDDKIVYGNGPNVSGNLAIIRPVSEPFQPTGGLKVLKGNLGNSVMKTSAVDEKYHVIEAEAIVFYDQEELLAAFKADELNKDFIAVLPFQGPRQKGMPELHNLTPSLTILQKRGFIVGLVTDGRMSGASGKIPAAIHVSPEAALGGAIGKIKTGDLIRLDAKNGTLSCLDNEINKRPVIKVDYDDLSHGRSLFRNLRSLLADSESGAGFL